MNIRSIALLLLGVTLSCSSELPPLHKAVSVGKLAQVKEILAADPTIINSKDQELGSTPLYQAIKECHPNITRYLIEKGADVTTPDKNGLTPLCLASYRGNFEIVRLLLDHNAPIDETTPAATTPLYAAASNGHLAIVRLLAERGATIDKPNNDGITPLFIAAINDHPEIVEQLALQGASISLQSATTKRLFLRMNENMQRYVQFLLPKIVPYAQALLQAAQDNAMNKVVKIICMDPMFADINAALLPGGNTALHFSILNGNDEMAKYIIAQNASVNAQNIDGNTPLHLATLKDNVFMVRHLIAQGANINAQNMDGDTALHLATERLIATHREVLHSEKTDAAMIFTLLSMGADPGIENKKHETAIYKAASCQSPYALAVFGAWTNQQLQRSQPKSLMRKYFNKAILPIERDFVLPLKNEWQKELFSIFIEGKYSR